MSPAGAGDVEQAKGVEQDATQLWPEFYNEQVAALKAAQVDGGTLDGQLKSLGSDVAALKKQGNPSAAIQGLEQDILVLKSQIDNRPAAAASGGASVQEFDAFRAQTTRNLNTLQSQIQNLQQQINARP